MRKKIISFAAGAALLTAGLVGSTDAGASTMLAYFATASGSQIRALNNTITSDLTANSTVSTFAPGINASNSTGIVSVQGVLNLGAVQTAASSVQSGTLNKALCTSKTTNVSLLGGAITISAVNTTAYSQLDGSTPSSNVSTQFLGIHIVGINLPVNIPQNYAVSLPGLATIVLNFSRVTTVGGTTGAVGAGAIITLLKPVGNSQAGATIALSPVMTRIGDQDYQNTGHTASGAAFASHVVADVANLAGIQSDPTAQVGLTPNKTFEVTSAAVNLNPVLQLGALDDTATGEQTTARGYADMDSKIAGINLLNGLITATAVQAHATVNAPTGSPIAVSGYSKIANLTINGNPIPLTVAPNTRINLLNVAIITLNQQFAGPHSILVRAIDIVITTATLGLKAGTEIQLAVAGASAT